MIERERKKVIEVVAAIIKNDDKIFAKVTKDGKLDTAIKNCEYMEKLNKNGQASDRNPMTRVYKIVDGLKEYLE